jgi:hypothetical protein
MNLYMLQLLGAKYLELGKTRRILENREELFAGKIHHKGRDK